MGRQLIKSGQIYQRYITTKGVYSLERRLIIDATDTHVFYEELFEKSTSITVEVDPVHNQKQVGIKSWKIWARTAILEGLMEWCNACGRQLPEDEQLYECPQCGQFVCSLCCCGVGTVCIDCVESQG